MRHSQDGIIGSQRKIENILTLPASELSMRQRLFCTRARVWICRPVSVYGTLRAATGTPTDDMLYLIHAVVLVAGSFQ